MLYTVVRKSYIQNLLNESSRLKKIVDKSLTFVHSLSSGNVENLSKDDNTTHALLKELTNLSESLKAIKQVEEERKWTADGLALFIDILRKDNEDLIKLSDRIISSLVKFMGLNQGGIFVLNEESSDTYLDMLSCYAYDRKKFLKKRFALGEGLIGQVCLERQTLYMTDVPPDYVTITSGLGYATPRSILIVPLISKDKVMGIIELASFDRLQPYKISFVEKVAENIASTISSLRTSEHTTQLLKESQLQGEELNAQSEEMRQNLEELQAIQEELARKSAELERVRETEKERTEKQLEAQKRIMEKVNKGFMVKEAQYKEQIRELEERLKQNRTLSSVHDSVL